jgi:Zn-finger in ubiquitin-hydrolases and other protein
MPFRNRLPECVDYGTRGCAGVVIKSENLFCRKDEWARNGGKKAQFGKCRHECSSCGRLSEAILAWVHLRICRTCGHVGCCDDSKNRHVARHFHDTGHPIITSFEPGEAWRWCYEDEVLMLLPQPADETDRMEAPNQGKRSRYRDESRSRSTPTPATLPFDDPHAELDHAAIPAVGT